MTLPTPDLPIAEAVLSDVRTELARADQKAATLLALFSAVAAGIIAIFATRQGGIFALRNEVEWMAWAGIACLACSLACLLFGVRPNGVNRLRGNAYFALYAQYAGRPMELFAYLDATDNGEARCAQLIELSILATRKYKLIGRAVDLLGCSLTLVAAAMLLNAVL